MPWKEVTVVSQRIEFVGLVIQSDSNIREVCRRFDIAPKTAYKWLARFEEYGPEGLADRSRRPHCSPMLTPFEVEQAVLALRDEHPAWGGRKLRARLIKNGVRGVPAPSTITEILRRNGRIDAEEAAKHAPCQRFEHEAPNDLWQMDFKGDFATDSGRCYPLTVLDDHSRYSILLAACPDQRGDRVKANLEASFERYGLPWRILVDNGGPWSGGSGYPYTPLTVWLIRLGVGVCHSRPYHPQTQGKGERFHRTLEAEVLRYHRFAGLCDCQEHLSRWRNVYNQERPHESLDMATPASRYTMSPRAYPSVLPPIEYGPTDLVRKVQQDGIIYFKGRECPVGRAFHGYPVGVRPTLADGIFDVFFCHQKVAHVDLTVTDPET